MIDPTSNNDTETGTYLHLPKDLQVDKGRWDFDSSSSSEKKTTQENLRSRRGPKTKKEKVKTGANLAKLQAESKGKRGRLPRKDEYVALAEAKRAANDEKKRELRLEREARTYEMAEILKILRKSHLNPKDTAEEAALAPTTDITSQIRNAQAEVVRISKVNSNLKEDLQRILRVAASLTMGMIDVVRIRMGSEKGRVTKK